MGEEPLEPAGCSCRGHEGTADRDAGSTSSAVPAPLVSVVVPTFERPEATARAVRSALRQGVVGLEVIVVDDGSAAPPALEGMDARVRLIRHEANRGAAAARNTGMAVASGRWLAFLDSDDVWPDGSLARRIAWAERETAAGVPPLTVFGCGFAEVDGDGEARRTRFPREAARPADFASGCWFCPGSAVLVLREPVLEAVGGQDEGLRRLEDLDWFLRFALAGGRLRVQPIVGVEITVGHPPDAAAVTAAARELADKWRGTALPAEARRRLIAYLDLEEAAAKWRGGSKSAALLPAARSWLRVPRARLHLSPGWRNPG